MRLAHAVLALGLVACRARFDEHADAAGPGDAPSPTAITVDVQGHGVALVAGQLPCASHCVYDVGAIDLSTWAGEAWQFSTFSEPCGAASTCTAQPGSSVTVTFTRAPITANLVFVSSMTTPRTGLAGLDMTCTNSATAAGLTGTFVALASTSTIDARDRVTGARGWVGVDGLAVFDTTADLGSQLRPRSITLDEHGLPHSAATLTGSLSDGTKDTPNTCSDWTSTSGQAGCGYSDWTGPYTLGFVGTNCSNAVPVYCMETDRNVVVSLAHPPAPMGRYVFVTPSAYSIAGGIAAADALCASQANAAGLAGNFAAVLATSTTSAADHIGGVAGMWRRPDGVVVSFNGLDQDPLDAAITLDATGAVVAGNHVYFGANGLFDLGTRTCTDWTDGAAALRLDIFFVSTRPFAVAGSPPSCASPASLMCAQLP